MKFLRKLFNRARNGVLTDAPGNKKWYLDDQLHREDGPAVELANGGKMWFRNGLIDRDDGPAVEWANGDKAWYRFGLLHREDRPAVEWANGRKEWYRNGRLHRDDGPAVEGADGLIAWWKEGKLIEVFTAKEVAGYMAACEENRQFDMKRAVEQTVGAVREGLPQTITVARPIRLRL